MDRFKKTLPLLISGLVGLVLGAVICGGEAPPAQVKAEEVWTCSMHPEIRMPSPGQCPICGMDLVLAGSGGGDGHTHELSLSPTARALAEIRTAAVERQPVQRALPLVGRVTYDETLVSRVSAWVSGRIERLYVDVTGTQVRKGEHLLRLYSPELLTAQAELRAAARQLAALPEGSPARGALTRTRDATRERLRLWGVGARQIESVEKGAAPSESLTIYAPEGGVVVERQAIPGMYVKEGTPLYTLADLRRLWVELEVYESDLPFVRFGQDVTLEGDAWPGERFHGRVVFVAPVVDEGSRSVRVRVNVDNADLKLKPGMLVRASLKARLDGEGHAITGDDLVGKYVCPMHPDVVKDGPGTCDVCHMRLEPAESLGLVRTSGAQDPLVIPRSAPLLTGTRAIVYVEVPGKDEPTYEGREVKLGPRTESGYVVLAGLAEGERVVVNGAFKLDAAMQVEAKPSMMGDPSGRATKQASSGAASQPASQPSSMPASRPASQPAKKAPASRPSSMPASQPAGHQH